MVDYKKREFDIFKKKKVVLLVSIFIGCGIVN